MPPCGCSVALHSLSCFSLPCFRSLQPTLSCNKLHSLRLHYITGLRCTQHPYISAFCSPPAALFGSPAGRYGLRLTLFDCLHFVLAIKAVASCSALQAVMVFVPSHFSTDKNKNLASLPLPHVLYTAYRPFVSTTLAQLAGASQSQPFGRNPSAQSTQLQPTGCLFCSWLL